MLKYFDMSSQDVMYNSVKPSFNVYLIAYRLNCLGAARLMGHLKRRLTQLAKQSWTPHVNQQGYHPVMNRVQAPHACSKPSIESTSTRLLIYVKGHLDAAWQLFPLLARIEQRSTRAQYSFQCCETTALLRPGTVAKFCVKQENDTCRAHPSKV